MEERINVKEFVDGYEKSKNKPVYLKKLTINDYVPYGEKCFLANKIIESTSYDAQRNIKIDSAARYLLFVYTLLKSYTNLDVTAAHMTEEFDLLNRYGLIDEITNLIPEKEVNEFNKILSMTYEDFMTNHYEIHGFITDTIQKISNVIEGTSPELLDELRKYIGVEKGNDNG